MLDPQQKLYVHELARPQRAILVRQRRFQPHRAGGLIDLVVNQGERPLAEGALVLAFQDSDVQWAGSHALADEPLSSALASYAA